MNPAQKISLILMDGHRLGRQIFSACIRERESNIHLLAEVPGGGELLAMLEKQQPDVILLDMETPAMEGFKTLKVIAGKYPQTKTLILCSDCSEFYLSELMLHGAHGYISKTAFAAEVFLGVNKVYSEGHYFGKGVTGHIIQTLLENGMLQEIVRTKQLNTAEVENLLLICDAKQNKEVMAAMNATAAHPELQSRELYRTGDPEHILALIRYAVRAASMSPAVERQVL